MIKAKLDKYLVLAAMGYLLLIVGCVLPIVTMSFAGVSEGISLTSEGGDGFMIIGLLVLSLPIVLMARHRLLLIPAVLTFGIVMLNFVDIRGDELAMELFEFQWATWIILFTGSAALAAGGVMGFLGRGSNEPTVTAPAAV